MLLEMGVTLFAFDFAGCGMSEGNLITLGWNEKDDIRCVVDFLRESGRVTTLALWGRSMGAASALLHGHRDASIDAMVLDSPFADLHRLVRELALSMPIRPKPNIIVNAALRMLRTSVRKKSGLDLFRLKPIEHADSTLIPALFVAGISDDLISPSHSEDIHGRYAGDKNLVMVKGDHSSRRPQYLRDDIASFLQQRLLTAAAGSR
jgi:pimeloyl-ACP methyl ester carboxylesterase